MATARPIRIVRRPSAPRSAEPIPASPSEEEHSAPPSPESALGPYRVNRGGAQRAGRLFLLFLAATFALYAGLLGLMDRGPGGLYGNEPLLLFLAVLVVALLIVGWRVTLGQAPQGAWVSPTRLVVRERLGRRREFAIGPASPPVVARRYPSSWLATEPTALVHVRDVTGLSRHYLIGADVLPAAERPAA